MMQAEYLIVPSRHEGHCTAGRRKDGRFIDEPDFQGLFMRSQGEAQRLFRTNCGAPFDSRRFGAKYDDVLAWLAEHHIAGKRIHGVYGPLCIAHLTPDQELEFKLRWL